MYLNSQNKITISVVCKNMADPKQNLVVLATLEHFVMQYSIHGNNQHSVFNTGSVYMRSSYRLKKYHQTNCMSVTLHNDGSSP